MQSKMIYPFTILVSQEKMKLAQILNVTNLKIVTGKSRVFHALANLPRKADAVAEHVSTEMSEQYLRLKVLSAVPFALAVRTRLFHDLAGIIINN